MPNKPVPDWKDKLMAAASNLAPVPASTSASKPTGFSLPTLKQTTIMDVAEATARKAKVNTWLNGTGDEESGALNWMRRQIEAIAVLLGSNQKREEYGLVREDVEKAAKAMAELITDTPIESARESLLVVAMDNMIYHFPKSAFGLNKIADFGIQLGYLVGSDGKQYVTLPVSGTDGKWTSKQLSSTHKDAHRIISDLHKLAEQVHREKSAELKEAAQELRKGTDGNLIQVLVAGIGEATFFAHDEKRGERFHPGGNVRVKVENGGIYAISAVGRCSGIVGRAAELGVSIPVQSVENDRLELKKYVDDRDEFIAMVALHGLVHRGLKLAREQADANAKVNAMKTKATVKNPADFLHKNTVGTTYLFLKNGWEVGKGRDAKQYRHVQFLVERNEAGEIRVAECPAELEFLFTNCRDFAAPGERYSGLAYPLGSMLRVLWSAFKRSEDRKANQELEQEMLNRPGDNADGTTMDAAVAQEASTTETATA